MRKISVPILLCFLIALSSTAGVYKKMIPDLDPEAKCLDGSPGGLYVHQGSEPKKFLIFLIGGGYCAKESLSGSL